MRSLRALEKILIGYSKNICNEYRKAQNNLWFFQAENPVHQLLLSEIDNIVETAAQDNTEVSVKHSKENRLAI